MGRGSTHRAFELVIVLAQQLALGPVMPGLKISHIIQRWAWQIVHYVLFPRLWSSDRRLLSCEMAAVPACPTALVVFYLSYHQTFIYYNHGTALLEISEQHCALTGFCACKYNRSYPK